MKRRKWAGWAGFAILTVLWVPGSAGCHSLDAETGTAYPGSQPWIPQAGT